MNLSMKKIMAALLALAATFAQAQVPAPRFDPAQGQTAGKQAADLAECGRWSEQQTGYSPQAEAAAGLRAERLAVYLRGTVACMKARGYGVK